MGFFGHKKEISVPLTFDVMMKCQCPTCPVQASSSCSKPKIDARLEMVKNYEMSKNMNNDMAPNMTPEMMKNIEMIKNSGMMANADLARNMSYEQVRNMSREDMQKMSDEMMKNTSKEKIEMMKPNADDMPGPYCANGVAACKDLDFNKTCICSGCEVFKNYNLTKAKPTIYFCKDGKAT